MTRGMPRLVTRRRPRLAARLRCERGQATVEWIGLALLVALALAALLAVTPAPDGRSFGGFLAHRIACAAGASCNDGQAALARAYGDADAALARAYAPSLVYEPGERQLPVDWRRCRLAECAEAPDDRDLDAHLTDEGTRATAFTRLIRRGGKTYLQYWLYYPDSNSRIAGSDKLWAWSWLAPRVRELLDGTSDYPGFHRDDWESYMLRLDPNGSAWVRASSHGHFQGCKQRICRNRWVPRTGWTRVSAGSHAGHIPYAADPRRGRLTPQLPGRQIRERTTTSEGLRLIPLETIDRESYEPLDGGIKPPWRKEVYRRPGSDAS